MRIGLMKAMPEFYNLRRNMDTLKIMAEKAAVEGVELLMTCECYLDGYCAKLEQTDQVKLRSVALADDSDLLAEARDLCARLHMGLILGYSSLQTEGVLNTALLIGPDGREIGRYHKTHLYAHDTKYMPGQGFPVYDTPWGRIGMLICADRRWPEASRELKKKGAEMILIPTYGMHHERNMEWMCTRAYENECYLAFAHPEQSFICNPSGVVEARLDSNRPGILVHDIDISACSNDMFSLRRTDLYA